MRDLELLRPEFNSLECGCNTFPGVQEMRTPEGSHTKPNILPSSSLTTDWHHNGRNSEGAHATRARLCILLKQKMGPNATDQTKQILAEREYI